MADKQQRVTALNENIAKMCKGKQKDDGFTFGWDVVVSYSEEQINGLLKSKWEKTDSKIIKKIEMKSLVYNEDTEVQETVVRTLELGAPMIRFNGGAISEPALELHMPIKSGYREKERANGERYGNKIQMPVDAFLVRLTGIRLGTVAGKYEEVKGQSDPPVKSSQKSCVFSSNVAAGKNVEVAWVVLDIPIEGDNLGVNLDVTLQPSNVDYQKANTMVNSILGSLTDYFKKPREKIDKLSYALATVKNTPLVGKDNKNITVDLTPKQFRMATFANDAAGQMRCLSLFIETASGKNAGVTDNLQTIWPAAWINSDKATPIPNGYTASILFNSDLIFNAIIKPGFEKGGDWKVEPRDTTKEGGVAFVTKKLKPWNTSGFVHKYEATFNNCEVVVDPFSKDLSNDPASIHIWQKVTNGQPEAHIDWTFTTESEWVDGTQDPKWWNLGDRAGFGSDNIRTTYTFNDDVPLKSTVTDKTFEFDIDTDGMRNKWKFTDESIDRTGAWYERAGKWIANLITAGPPDDVNNKRKEWMKSLKPDIDFPEVGMGFFLTTNLLLPGAKVISLDSVAGLRFPRDIMLVGDVVQGDDKEKK